MTAEQSLLRMLLLRNGELGVRAECRRLMLVVTWASICCTARLYIRPDLQSWLHAARRAHGTDTYLML